MNPPASTARAEAPSGKLLSSDREADVFWRLRRRLVGAGLRRMLRTARFRITLVVVLSVVFWWGLFYLFLSGFVMLGGMYMIVVQPLYNAFFTSLMVMLLVSSAIIMYGGLYRSPEAAFLLTTPARTERIFAYMFQEAIWFSSWGFLLLGSPMLVASGVVIQAPWYYYALLLPLIVSFLWIPVTLGAILCLVVVDRLGRIRRGVVWGAILVALVGLIWVGWSIARGTKGDLMTPEWFHELSGRLRFADFRLLPSSWFSTGLVEAMRRPVFGNELRWTQSVLYLTVLISNDVFLYQVAVWLAGRVYRSSYSRLQTEQMVRRRGRSTLLDRLLLGWTPQPPSPIRLLLVKDLRLFRRDPVQWTQFLIFFGLLGLYFLNIRRVSTEPRFLTMIGFLNLAVVGLILSTFTTRFIFPMISLEGRRFWILGPLPVRRETIVWTKFVFAALGSLVPCCALMWLSDAMLNIGVEILLVHQISCIMLCLGLSGIAVGLGAKMPELGEQSPSKIAAGFGGTLNLVLSAVFIVLIVMLTAVPYHFFMLNSPGAAPATTENWSRFVANPTAIGVGVVLTVVVGLVATIWPMRVGLKAFREMDF